MNTLLTFLLIASIVSIIKWSWKNETDNTEWTGEPSDEELTRK